MNKRQPNDNPWRAAGLVGAMSADFVLCIVLGYYGGAYVSKLTGGGHGWVIAGLLLGLLAGIAGAAFLIKRFLEDTNG